MKTLHSMTGFARVETLLPQGKLSWELRAVNQRHLEAFFKLPEEFRPLEPQLRQHLASHVSRGKIELGLRWQPEAGVATAVVVDSERLQQVLAAVDTVHGYLGASQTLDPLRLLQFPGVIKNESPEPDMASVLPAAVAAFQQAVRVFNQSRLDEGSRIVSHLEERLVQIEQHVAAIQVRLPLVREQWLIKLRSKLQELAAGFDEARLAQEVALMAQRLDVDEEISRLRSHLLEVAAQLLKKEAVGRRLDFLMQELNREANTTASKSQDAEMTRHAVEIKVLIEQMREQVQNVE
jgi:uncharacterized protein (TIGR00255 family)